MNQAVVSGNITRDLQPRVTKTGKAWLSFSIADNRNVQKPNGETVQVTDYHNIVAWGALAENIATNCQKGQRIIVVGRINTRKYTDKTGKDAYITEVVAEECGPSLKFAKTGARGDGTRTDEYGFTAPPSAQGSANFQRFGKSYAEEDIPF